MSQTWLVDCSTDTATVTPYTAADAANQQNLITASQQEAVLTANAATIAANIQTHLNQIESWLAANPNGAILTAAQTAFLARMLVGVGRLILGLVNTIGQAT